MQTHLGLTSCPRTRSKRAKSYSHMMMLKTGSLFLILYGLCQIPLAQGQTPRKDETMETTQTWKSQESGAGAVLYARPHPQETLESNEDHVKSFHTGKPCSMEALSVKPRAHQPTRGSLLIHSHFDYHKVLQRSC
ncbi:unnamed protein product [Gadus morhua 'NCC']